MAIITDKIISLMKKYNLHGLTRHCVAVKIYTKKVYEILQNDEPIDAEPILRAMEELRWSTRKWSSLMTERGYMDVHRSVMEIHNELDELSALLLLNMNRMIFRSNVPTVCDN